MTDTPTAVEAARGVRVGASAVYAAQGLTYASLVTALPQLKDRYGITDDTISLLTLTVVLGAAAGSLVADRIAVRLGSRTAAVVGLSIQAASLLAIALPTPFPLFWAMCGAMGVGLGCIDASAAMQGVLVQRRLGRPVMGSMFASQTGAQIVAALVMSAGAVTVLGASLGLGVAALAAGTVAVHASRALDPSREAADAPARSRLPLRGLWAIGLVILAAFAVDSTVSTWSSIHLEDGLGATAQVAPLGYAIYAGATLLTRLATDRLALRVGRARLAGATIVIAAGGLLLAAALPVVPAALLGFALAGLGVGALVPLAFSAAGDLDEARSDEVIARVNLFNYPGALLGAVVPGLLAHDGRFGIAFALAAVALIPALAVVPRFRGGAMPQG